MGENLEGVEGDGKVIRRRADPLSPDGGIVILRGTLAPGSAVIKRSAASEELLRHRGRAYVFETRADLLEHIDDDDLPVDASTVLVLKNGGPKGGPGMPEWGQLPIPAKLLRQGVTDMLRISDARMSGTSYGTVVLHTTPEAAAGGPLAVVQTGDEIELNVDERRLDLLVPAEELERRLAAWTPPAAALHARLRAAVHRQRPRRRLRLRLRLPARRRHRARRLRPAVRPHGPLLGFIRTAAAGGR